MKKILLIIISLFPITNAIAAEEKWFEQWKN